MKRIYFIVVLFISFTNGVFAAGETTTQIGYAPASHPLGCVALQLRNLDSVGTHTWTFNPPVVNAATGPPAVGSITVAGGSEPIVYWTGAGDKDICYDGDCETFHSCNCNPFPADDFDQAPLICNSNLYCGTTSSAYGVDMETTVDPVHTGSLENNSWLQFIADSTDVTFNINVAGTCEMQFAVYELGTSAGSPSFTIFTDLIWTSTDGFTGNNVINATGLTPGTQYYIHLDGDGGQECDYEVSFVSGFQTLDVSGPGATICPGDPATLTITPSDPAANYVWSDSGGGGPYPNNFSITVNPIVNTTYNVIVTGGSCNLTDTLNIPVTIDPGCILPIELLDFTAECKGNYTSLKWQTFTEINNSYFTLWESEDGLNYTKVGNIEGEGNSNTIQNYRWIYDSDLSGTIYYKLSQTDYDGSMEFFNPISIKSCERGENAVYVDKNNDILINGSEINEVYVFNTLGQIMAHSTNNMNETEIKFSSLQSGIYIVSIVSVIGEKTNTKVVVR